MSQPTGKLSRRTLFAGAGTAGAIAAAAAVMPRVAQQQREEAAPELKPAPERGGGYQLTEHVQRYYKTTRI
jgi:hypothetical protein